MAPRSEKPTARAMRVACGKASRGSGDPLRLPGAETRTARSRCSCDRRRRRPCRRLFSRRSSRRRRARRWCRADLRHACGDRTGQDPVKTALRLPVLEHPANARAMNFRTAVRTCCDRQFFPLAAHAQQSQEVVENPMQAQFGCRAAAPRHQTGQDKLRQLREAQMRRNPLPVLTLHHLDQQSDRILTPFRISPQT